MKLNASLKAVGFAVMLATASMSNAATTDWGTVSPGTTFSQDWSVPQLGTFEDMYTFSLLTSAVAGLKRNVTLTLDQFGDKESGFIGLTYGLYSAMTHALINYASYDSGSKVYAYSGLSAGDYYLKVSGEGWRDNADIDMPKYNGSINITAAPTPEPETYAMLFAGLGILGTVVRRRSRNF